MDSSEFNKTMNSFYRETCLYCVSKHLSQALVLVTESTLGYPLHKWLAVGHLAEAEAESLQEYPEISKEIRCLRVTLMGQPSELNGKECSLIKILEKVVKIIGGK